MEIGFIGAGTVAGIHLDTLREQDRATVAAVCDVDGERAEAVAAEHGATAYTDDARMLDGESLDAVLLCVPPFAHDGQERRVLESGADLFVEKPVALDAAAARDVAETVATHDAVVHVGYAFRDAPVVEFVRERLSPDDVSHVVGRYAIPEPPDAPWWADRDRSGGQLVEQSTHVFDTLRYLFGDVTWVGGVGSRRHRRTLTFEDTTAVALRHDTGVVATVTSSTAADETDVSIHVSGPAVELTVDLLDGEIAGTLDDERVDRTPDESHFTAELERFLDAVAAGDPDAVRCPYAEGVATLELTLDATEAVETGTPVVR
ncbi:MAG: Gfo/Idh/MocA family oxidoreductase [Haloarculaceae archaeon]